MRILRVSRTYPRSIMPGMGLPPYYLSKCIEAPTLLITKKLPGQPVSPPPHVTLKEISYPEPTLPEKLSVFSKLTIGVGKGLGYLIFLAKSLPCMWRFKPNIVHVHTPLPLLHGIFGKMFLGAKLVLTFHGTGFVRFESSAFLQWVVRRWVDAVFYVSKTMGGSLKELLPSTPLIYTPNGVELQQFHNKMWPRKNQLVAIGNLRWQKGYEYMLNAVNEVFREHEDYVLTIIGTGVLEDQLKRQVETLGMKDRVEFLGTQPRDRIADFLNESQIFVMSSVTEGFPKALLEAIACGTPVVVTDVGSCREMAQNAGLVVMPRDVKALADAITRLINDSALWERFSSQGPKIAKEYDWSFVAQKVYGEYEKLLYGG